MKILQMTHQGDEGGSTNSITWLTRGLAERGHEVWLACRGDSLIARRFRDGAVHVVDTRYPSGPALLPAAMRWKRWVVERGVDVVNAHASLDRRLVSYLRVLGSRAGLVHTRRNVPLSSGGRLRARFDTATTDAIVAVSEEVAANLRRRGIPAGHVTTIRNGLPLDALRPPDPGAVARLRDALGLAGGVPVVGVVARRKSQDDLLRAAAALGRPLEILLAGMDEDAELASLMTSLPEGVRAQCLGFRDDVPDLFGLFDVFVLPSTIEGFSLALLEAMARGLPCVATDAGGNREALAEGAGLLVPPGDPDALAKGLARVLDDSDASRAMGDRARRRAHAEFDVARTIERTEALYRRIRPEGSR